MDTMTQDTMTRSEAAWAAGVNAETLRYYERRRLVPPPPRSAGGYRQYSADYVERVRFIKRAQELGFTLDEIRDLLTLRVDPATDSGAVRARTEAKIEAIEEKIRDLERMRDALAKLVAACSGHGPTSDCPILEALQDEEAFQTALPSVSASSDKGY